MESGRPIFRMQLSVSFRLRPKKGRTDHSGGQPDGVGSGDSNHRRRRKYLVNRQRSAEIFWRYRPNGRSALARRTGPGKRTWRAYMLGSSLPPFLSRRTTAIPGMRVRGFPTIRRGTNGNPDWAGFVSIAWCLIRVIMIGSGLGCRPWVFSAPRTAAIPGRLWTRVLEPIFSPTRSPNSVNVLTSSFPQNLGRMSSINRTIVVFSAATRQAKTGHIKPGICRHRSALCWDYTPKTRTRSTYCPRMKPQRSR